MFALEAVHILGGQNDAKSLVSAHCNKVAKRMVVKVEHVVRFVNDGEVTDLYVIVVDCLLGSCSYMIFSLEMTK